MKLHLSLHSSGAVSRGVCASQSRSPSKMKTITMSEFFALPEVQALQAIQKANRYGSPQHWAAHNEMIRLASSYVT